MRASSPLVAMRPSRRKTPALTGRSGKRGTCPAGFLGSDQRMAEVSKLPESACVPSGEMASARTGPPWPRNCACAVADATSSSASTTKTWAIVAALAENSGIGRTHSQGADFFAHRLLAERGEKGAHRRPLASVFHRVKILVHRCVPGKVKPVHG